MDAAIRELVGICLLACACVALAWVHEADYFVLFFGLAAAIAGAEGKGGFCVSTVSIVCTRLFGRPK
jgi:hypothetical protein